MLSRRLFLLSSLGLAVWPDFFLAAEAKHFSKRSWSGLHKLAYLSWPPAIVPDHIAIAGRNHICVTDEFGQLVIIDFKNSESGQVVGDTKGLGKKVIDFAITGQHGYALTSGDAANDGQYMLSIVNLRQTKSPSLAIQIPLEQFSEPICLAANQDLICVGGISTTGANMVAIYRHSRSTEPSLLSTIKTNAAIQKMDLQDKHLVVLGFEHNTQVDYINLYFPHAPQIRKTIKVNGDYRVMSRFHNNLILAGQATGEKDFEITTIMLEPTPHAVDHVTLGDITNVCDAAAQKDRFLILAERGKQQVLITFTCGDMLELTPEQTLILPADKITPGLIPHIAVKDERAYIASGWSGIEVISYDKGKSGWQNSSTLTIPRLPASCVASWQNFIVVAGTDLKLYDIARPDKPELVVTSESGGNVKSLVIANNNILTLNIDKLSLRKTDNLNVITHSKAQGQHLAYDNVQQKAFVLSNQEKKTVITPYKVSSNQLVAETSLELSGSYHQFSIANNAFLVQGLDEISLYRIAEQPDLMCSRHFDNLALRDVFVSDDYIAATAIDHNSKGFFLLLTQQGRDLKILSITDLPHDGTALTVADHKAAIVGKSASGKDTLTIINLALPAGPAIIASQPTVEAAAAVAIHDGMVIVVGRGLEIFRLS